MPRFLRLLLLLTVFIGSAARADHFSGASITYACQGANTYRIFLDMYLDCSGTPITPQTINFSNSCGVVFSIDNLSPTSVEVVTPACPSQVGNTTCDGGPYPGIRRYRFELTLFLSPCNSWNINWSICCRANLVNLGNVPGIYAEATLNNLGGLCDASPVFADQEILYVCAGQPVAYNPGVSDPNGNTMAFSLVSARFGTPTGSPALYAAGYSGIAPIPGIAIDPTTGQITFQTNTQGSYVLVVQVATYTAGGVLIGTVMRDFIVVVRACNDPPPTTSGLSNLTGGLYVGPGAIEVCGGSPFCVDVTFSDPSPIGIVQITSNIAAQIPGATITVSGTNPAVATICGNATTANLPRNILVVGTDDACPISNSASFSILITGVDPPGIVSNPGTNGSISVCPGAAQVSLFSSLGGTPQFGGVWTGPSGSLHSDILNPSVDPAGVYTYTVGDACNPASATVTVIFGGDSPGTNAVLSLCSNSPAVSLFNALGGSPDAGGVWTGPSPVVGGMYDPPTMAPGAYVYTVTSPSCPPSSATVTVAESVAPNAGIDGTLAFCSNSAAAPLISGLTGSPQAGGTWSGPSTVTGGQYNPVTMVPGVYTYTRNGVLPCVTATATVTVTETPAPVAGTNGTITLCSTSAPIALVNSLGGIPGVGGTWSGPSTVVGGMYDPATMGPGAYVYTVTATAPCAAATATVTVTENQLPNVGTNGTLTLCSNSAAVGLITGLGGTPGAGGTWSGPSTVTAGQYNPATMDPGVYTYTRTGVAPCANASATVTVTENPAPVAGTNGTLAICSNGAAVALNSSLGGSPAAGGTWSGPSTVTGGQYDPATMIGQCDRNSHGHRECSTNSWYEWNAYHL